MIIEALKEYTDPVNHAYFYPEQFISVSEKEKEQWIKGTMDYFANIAFAQYKQNIQFRKNYRLLNGEFNFSDYTNNAEIQEFLRGFQCTSQFISNNRMSFSPSILDDLP